ncbi:MAG: hypothetical protein KVP17_001386 [Porospora cf. gigantea B]|nr:MAG: hypothetical protein KVP17_001386 [Porospora cf. gigantea B]
MGKPPSTTCQHVRSVVEEDVGNDAESARLVNDTSIADDDVRSLFKSAVTMDTHDAKRRVLATALRAGRRAKYRVYFEFLRDNDDDAGTLYVSTNESLVSPLDVSRKHDVVNILEINPPARDVHTVAENVHILRSNNREWMVAIKFPAYSTLRALKQVRQHNYALVGLESADISPVPGTEPYYHCLEWKGVSLENLSEIVLRTLSARDDASTAPVYAGPVYAGPVKAGAEDSVGGLSDMSSGSSVCVLGEGSGAEAAVMRRANTESTDTGRLSQFVFPDLSLNLADILSESAKEQPRVDMPSPTVTPRTCRSTRRSLAPLDFSGMASITENDE